MLQHNVAVFVVCKLICPGTAPIENLRHALAALLRATTTLEDPHEQFVYIAEVRLLLAQRFQIALCQRGDDAMCEVAHSRVPVDDGLEARAQHKGHVAVVNEVNAAFVVSIYFTKQVLDQ